MTKQTTILTLMLVLASPAGAQQTCNPAQGTGQCGFLDANGNVVSTAAEAYASYQQPYNTYVEPAPVYRPPPPPPTHDCTAREGGETCFDIRPGRIGSSYSTNAAGDFDGPMVESYPDGTPKSITNYRNGEMAESTHYYPDGAIETVMPHQNGEIHGIVKHYRQNGTLEYEIPFCNGETCGEQHNYDEQGNIVKITRFDANGDVESVQEIAPGNSAKKKPRRKS
ncbi:MAG: toxin-antitoxin system YwqK family antitoxin [Cardiobacterium sp.]